MKVAQLTATKFKTPLKNEEKKKMKNTSHVTSFVTGFLRTTINNSQIEHCSSNIQSISYKNNIFRESESER